MIKKKLKPTDQDTKDAISAIEIALEALGTIEVLISYEPESIEKIIDSIWAAKHALYDLKWRLKNDKERK